MPNTLKMNQLPVVRIKLNPPPLSKIVEAILPTLAENFEHVSAEVVQCPDFTQAPFNLTSEGLSGDENVVDIGDYSNLIPVIKRDKLYNIKDLKQVIESEPLFVIGPSCGPFPFIGVDSEYVVNLKITGDSVENSSHIFSSTQSTGHCIHSSLSNDETRCSIIANFFTCNGLKGEVLKIVCEVRKGLLNFPQCIVNALSKHFGQEIIAMGGVVLIEHGKVKIHVVKPDLDKSPIKSVKEIGSILNFIELSPPAIGLGCIVSHDPGLNLRKHHFHVYTAHGEGGHYHYDKEPKTIKYTGYFSIAKQLIKIDKNSEEVSNFDSI